jgi:uncharacterized membrane protein (UPF0182 family)
MTRLFKPGVACCRVCSKPWKICQPRCASTFATPRICSQVQAESLMTYHMTDPQVFYNREDQWRAPTEIYASEASGSSPTT